jgi:hypothetical protein
MNIVETNNVIVSKKPESIGVGTGPNLIVFSNIVIAPDFNSGPVISPGIGTFHMVSFNQAISGIGIPGHPNKTINAMVIQDL